MIKTRCFGTVFNFHTTALLVWTGPRHLHISNGILTVIAAIKIPLSVAQKVSYLFPSSSSSFALGCWIIPVLLWTWSMSVYFSAVYSLLLKY